jgi:alkylation response protein AidB-like acyl-CoA dehydrogenase
MNPATALSRAVFKEEHRIYRESVRRYLENEVAPHYEAWERAGEAPRSFWHDAGAAGLLCRRVGGNHTYRSDGAAGRFGP